MEAQVRRLAWPSASAFKCHKTAPPELIRGSYFRCRRISRFFDTAAVVHWPQKGGENMEHLTPEYLCLFHAITEAIEELDRLKADLMAAQRRAEELYVGRTD